MYLQKEKDTLCKVKQTITSEEECKKATGTLGLGNPDHFYVVEFDHGIPQGCLIGQALVEGLGGNGLVYFNKNFSGKRASSLMFKPVCKGSNV